ncbi:unnamed protein product [Pleuronectes platessa]|uniref:Uncharacterized protein n=1 Tax=Pleuronectes platessa TaxID=8262 RepID=A0A9N7U4I2_PLEPL|nr:unnamed protein product [Pleuronectes platessa]
MLDGGADGRGTEERRRGGGRGRHGAMGRKGGGGLQRLLGSGLCVLGKLGSPFKSAHVAAFWWLRLWVSGSCASFMVQACPMSPFTELPLTGFHHQGASLHQISSPGGGRAKPLRNHPQQMQGECQSAAPAERTPRRLCQCAPQSCAPRFSWTE